MAGRPFRFGVSVLCLVHPKQVYEPIEMRPQVLRAHHREAPKTPLRPRAQVVHHGHRPDAQGVRHVRLVRQVGALRGLYWPWMRLLLVVHDERLGCKMARQRVLHALHWGFPVAADLRHGVLMDVDRYGDAELCFERPRFEVNP